MRTTPPRRPGRPLLPNQRLQRRSRPPNVRLTVGVQVGMVAPGRWAAGPPLRRESLGGTLL